MREFVTSAEKADAPEAGEPIPIKIDGREIVFNAPDTNQLILLTAAIEASESSGVLAATLINSFFAMIENDEDQSHLRARLFNSKDHFGLDTITEVMSSLMEEWSGKATPSSSDSSTSPPRTGSTSKGTHSGRAFHRGPTHSPSGATSSNGGSGAVLKPTQSD
jgi:hypothetical protein